MGELSKLLKALQENPEDLSSLPQAIAKAQELEEENEDQAGRIGTLQENYRKVLKMVPIPGAEPTEPEPEPETTIDDAVAELKNMIKGDVTE